MGVCTRNASNPEGSSSSSAPLEPIRIALVNNMPKSAFDTTTRQFTRLLCPPTSDVDVILDVYVLPGATAATTLDQHLGRHLGTLENLERQEVDGLIVTGCEPLKARIEDEAYWPAMTELAAWSEKNTFGSIWSCLAAHAAVLSSDRLVRRPLSEKRSGIYSCEIVSDHPLVAGARSSCLVPHSRSNELLEDDLRDRGFEILTRSQSVGVDAFVKQDNSLRLFLQGHPEYDARSLLFEFRRDADRWLKGERSTPPSIPENYFHASDEHRLADALGSARRTGSCDQIRSILWQPIEPLWRVGDEWPIGLFQRWLFLIAEKKFGRRGARRRQDENRSQASSDQLF